LPRTRIDRINRQIASLLLFSSNHDLLIVIGLLSLLALTAWQTQYPCEAPQHLTIGALPVWSRETRTPKSSNRRRP